MNYDYLPSPAIVVSSVPSTVQGVLSAKNQTYENGMILVNIPERKLTNVVCRYSLSIPWIQLQPGWKVWVQPTFQDMKRWVVLGIEEPGTPTDTDVLLFNLPAGNMKITIGNCTIETDGVTSVKINGTNHEVLI